jgi:polar amino acid transport system substrate-binding protein
MDEFKAYGRYQLTLSFAYTRSSIYLTALTMTSPLDTLAVAPLLCPKGKLRASINLGNPILASKDALTGEAKGVSVDLSRELARRLGVSLELKVFDAAAKSVAAVTSNEADIGFFAIDPLRGEGISFSAAYVLIEGCYMVKQDSAIRANADVDKAGVRIAVGKGSAYDLFLSREIKNASLERAPTSPAVVDYFLQNKLEVAAGVKQQLEADAQRLSASVKLRLLDGNFMVIQQAMGIPNTRGAEALNYLRGFVEDVKRSGFVAAALHRHQIAGAAVASLTH